MHTELLMESLKIMAEGMIGIFVFMMIFYLIIMAFNKSDSKKKA